MKVIVIGASQAGIQIARTLIREKSAVTFLERDERIIRTLTDRMDCKVVRGDGTNINDLEQAGAVDADFVLVFTESDEVNLTCCYVISHYFPDVKTVMRLRNIEPETSLVIQRTMGGSCLIVNPVQEVASAICSIVQAGTIGPRYSFFDDRIHLISLVVDANHPFADKSIAELRQASKIPFLIPFLRQQGNFVVASGQTVVQENDTVYLAAKKGDITNFLVEDQKRNKQRVVILGGNDVAVAIAKLLLSQNQGILARIVQRLLRSSVSKSFEVKIIERNFQRCRELKELLPELQILNTDVTDEDIFQEENLGKADVFIAATNNSELNIVTSLYFKQVGVGRAIVAVRNRNFFNLASKLQLDSLISTNSSLVNAVLSHIHGREIRRILSIADGSNIEMLEIEISPGAPVIGKSIRELKLPEKTLISFVYRNEAAIIPDGSITINQGDLIVVITTHEFLERSRLIFSKVG